MSYLNDCREFLAKEFPNEWIEEYLIINEATGENGFNCHFDIKLKKVLKKYPEFFINSIITGEYIDSNNFTSILHEVTIKIEELTTYDFENLSYTAFQELNKFNKYLMYFVTKYIGFQKYISSYNSNSNSHLIFKLEKDNIINEYASSLLSTFLAFISLYTFEHFLSEKLEFIRLILNWENRLEESDIDERYHQVFRAKIQFLKFKLLYRYKLNLESDINSEFVSTGYLVNNEEVPLNQIPTNPVQYEELKAWEIYLINHYHIDQHIDKKYFNDEFNKIKNIQIENRNIIQLHFCIKYFKDVVQDKKNLKHIVNEIERRYTIKNDFIYGKIYLYALNNLLSIYCKFKDNKKIISVSKKIEVFQNQTQNKNFFCDLKLLDYKSQELFKKIDESKGITGFNGDKYKDDFAKLEELIKKTRNRINWSDSHQNLVFQLDYNDSVVNVSNFNLPIKKIYFPSSFVLPIATHENLIEFNKIEELFLAYKTKYELYNNLLPDINSIKEAKEDIKRIEKKSLETITVFTAIISFIVGSIVVMVGRNSGHFL